MYRDSARGPLPQRLHGEKPMLTWSRRRVMPACAEVPNGAILPYCDDCHRSSAMNL